jgi:hypothetical protein
VPTLAHGLVRLIDALLWPFDQLPPLLGLLLFSIVTGAAMLWTVGKTTPQRLVERARSQMIAGIYEVRLFLDSPRRILAAQGRLLAWSAAYLGSMLPALALLALPLGLIYLRLEVRYGLDSLPVGQPIVVRAALADGVDPGQLVAEGGPAVQVTAPPVRDEATGEVFFRVVVAPSKTAPILTLRAGNRSAVKELRAGAGPASPERTSGAAILWSLTDEPPLEEDAPVRAISATHPPLERSWLLLPWWWLTWLLAATAAALALRKRFAVVL